MEKIKCNVLVVQESCDIKITGLENDITINYLEDVDFTDLISVLVKTIDLEKQIELSISAISEEEKKLKLVIDTLRSIFEKYNLNINSKNEISEKKEVDDFWGTEIGDKETSKNTGNDDLPF